MLWPHVRQPGDCLTDAEIRAGQTGVYNGPLNTNPDVSAMGPDTPGQNEVTSAGTSANSTNRGVLFGEGPPITNTGRSRVTCTKGWMWPFVRDAGDCLTQAERQTNPQGVYGGGTVTQVSAADGTAERTEPAATAASDSPASAPAPATETAKTTCSKGWLWPFVRREGDCPTAAERQN